MTFNLLILGGTTEATALSALVAARGLQATISYAGRVAAVKAQHLPMRVGGFGGVDGLCEYLTHNRVTHVVDATHPFASQMSHNAAAACARANVSMVALTRAPWAPVAGDSWTHVPDISAAALALPREAKRVFLAVGRMHLAEFARCPQHHYLLRLIDPPKCDLPLPNTTTVLDRGPFTVESDHTLLSDHQIELVVSKNSGGSGAQAKLTAARALGIPVVMIDRPAMPARIELHSVEEVINWLTHDTSTVS